MARYRRGDQHELRVADDLEARGTAWTVDLIAKKATGVEGYRLTLSFIEVDGTGAEFVGLDPVDSRDEVEELAGALSGDPERIREILASADG